MIRKIISGYKDNIFQEGHSSLMNNISEKFLPYIMIESSNDLDELKIQEYFDMPSKLIINCNILPVQEKSNIQLFVTDNMGKTISKYMYRDDGILSDISRLKVADCIHNYIEIIADTICCSGIAYDSNEETKNYKIVDNTLYKKEFLVQKHNLNFTSDIYGAVHLISYGGFYSTLYGPDICAQTFCQIFSEYGQPKIKILHINELLQNNIHLKKWTNSSKETIRFLDDVEEINKKSLDCDIKNGLIKVDIENIETHSRSTYKSKDFSYCPYSNVIKILFDRDEVI